MTKEAFVQKLDNVCFYLKWELQNAAQGANSHRERQLMLIIEELRKMKDILDPNAYSPYYPKSIVDEWSFHDELGNLLMELARDYQRLKVKP